MVSGLGQESGPYQVESGSGMSEDCLYLNIFVARQTADTRQISR